MAAPTERVPVRVQAAVYGAALFSNTMSNMVWVALPLWTTRELRLSPFLIGIALGSRYVGPILLSIHGGALMDRFGTRRVMIILAAIGAVVPLLFPVLPFFGAVVVLQIFGGIAEAFCWVGAQALVGQAMKGHATYAGRMSFWTRIGIFIGPTSIGAAWSAFGPWGGFAVMSLWSVGVLVAVLLLPADAIAAPPPARVSVRNLLPRVGDYIDAFRLLAVPTLLFVMIVTVLRQVGAGIQGSFYTVYLESIGLSATMIGVLMTVNGVVGLLGSLSVAPMLRYVRERWLLLWTAAGSVVFVAITPMLWDVGSLMVASGLRGWVLAASLVLIVALIAQAAGAGRQGKAMGLRVTVNQAMSAIVPVVMGGIAEIAGIEASFYWTGGIALVLFVVIGLSARRMLGAEARS